MRTSDSSVDEIPFAAALAREEWPVLIALPALCAVIVLAVPIVGWWALLLATAVYAIGYHAFSVARGAGVTHSRLVAALGRMSEMNGVVPPGHADRAAALAVAIGSRLGLSRQQLATVEAAAQVRTAGLVGREDSPGFRPGFDHRAVVRWTQHIVGVEGRLAEVAGLVDDEGTGVLGAVVETAATYDEAVSGMGMTPAGAYALISKDAPPEQAAVTAALAAELTDRGVVVGLSVLQGGAAFTVDAMAE